MISIALSLLRGGPINRESLREHMPGYAGSCSSDWTGHGGVRCWENMLDTLLTWPRLTTSLTSRAYILVLSGTKLTYASFHDFSRSFDFSIAAALKTSGCLRMTASKAKSSRPMSFNAR